MKINSITANAGYLKGRASERSTGRKRECVQNNLKQMNNDQINTTIKRNSDGRVSFKGGTPFLHKAANFAADNPLVAEALFALVVTCAMRPLTIMATARTEEDKEKCAYQAAKSVSTGLVGLAVSVLVGIPVAAGAKLAQKKGAFDMPDSMKKESLKIVKQGVDDLTAIAKDFAEKNQHPELVKQINTLTSSGKLNLGYFKDLGKGAEKAFKEKIEEVAPQIKDSVANAIKEQKTVDNFGRTSKNIIDKMFQPIVMPVRATITTALIPVILGALGIKKTGNKPKEQSKEQTKAETEQPKDAKQIQKQNTTNFGLTNYGMFQLNNEKDIFKSFSGMVNNEN
ncbi:MAG: hypothetical protein IJY61_00520 [Candidatus Gastranaerophilales bacterium]|nr:hypothetical protein [Candidatus Gastranaerophilales bacterium]